MRASLILAALICLSFAGAVRAEDVKVTIIVTVPKDTDEKATLYVAGSLISEWKAEGAKLTRQADGTYKVELKLPKGQILEYKINGGNWDTVEKGENGVEIDNRTLKIDGEKEEKITVKGWAKKPGAAAAPSGAMHTLSGDVRTHEKFASKILGNERRILVWLPPGYEANASARYPVLYLHDGQNCFDGVTSYVGEWRADETAGELIAAGKIKPIIMVAVAHAGISRIDEYTPTKDAREQKGGRGELYARFLIEEVKPFIDVKYRTATDRAQTAVAGSSLGGLMSLYLGYKHGDVFGMCGVISPSLFWDDRQLLKSIAADPAPLKREKIWLDMGTAEASERQGPSPVENIETLAAVMKELGMRPETDFTSRKIDGAGHNEKAWSQRFSAVLQFFFPI